MSGITVLGAGAFGTSLAIALSINGAEVTLFCRDPEVATSMQRSRLSGPRLPGFSLPDTLRVTSDLAAFESDICLVAVPMQKLRSFLESANFGGCKLVACCKGIDLLTGQGPVATIQDAAPNALPAILTGPSFAADIARGLPTARAGW